MSLASWFGLAPVLVEGATDMFCGRPKDANPYCPETAADARYVWDWGWDEARDQLDVRGQEEAARWLRAAA
jgi:ribosome modulation factor